MKFILNSEEVTTLKEAANIMAQVQRALRDSQGSPYCFKESEFKDEFDSCIAYDVVNFLRSFARAEARLIDTSTSSHNYYPHTFWKENE